MLRCKIEQCAQICHPLELLFLQQGGFFHSCSNQQLLQERFLTSRINYKKNIEEKLGPLTSRIKLGSCQGNTANCTILARQANESALFGRYQHENSVKKRKLTRNQIGTILYILQMKYEHITKNIRNTRQVNT